MPIRAVRANLSLHFCRDAESRATRVNVVEQQQPLRIVRGFAQEDGAALVHLHNLSGGVLGGDQLQLHMRLESDAQALVTTTGSTRIYCHRAGEVDTTQDTRIAIAGGGLLEYLPDTLIPYVGSRYRQRTQIELAHDAGLFYWEVITPGREARGERFAYDLLRLDLDICAEQRLIARERMQIEPQQRSPTSLVRLGAYGYFATFYICKVGVAASRWLALEADLDEIARTQTQLGTVLWGVSTLVAHGIVVRALASTSRVIMQGLPRFWRAAKQELYQREAIAPRKIY